jgi:hypothetical protein
LTDFETVRVPDLVCGLMPDTWALANKRFHVLTLEPRLQKCPFTKESCSLQIIPAFSLRKR